MATRRGDAVACEAALLVERELLTTCNEEGDFSFTLDSPLDPNGETLIVYAPGFRDSVRRIRPDDVPISITLRRGVSRRSESVTRSDTTWRPIPRRSIAPDTDFSLGGGTVGRAEQAETAGGYQDLNRTLHALPGVAGDTAASARFRIRGAERGETLTLVDGIRVEDPTHLNGIFGALDPDLTTQVRVEGVSPSAAVPESNGGAVVARYLDGPRDRFDGALDLSFLGVGGHGAVAFGPTDQSARLVVGARRSLLQAYLGAFDAIGATDIPLDTVDFGSAFARLVVPAGRGGTVRLSLLHLHDRILLDDVNLRHRMVGGSLRWDLEPGPRTRIYALAAWGWEESAEPPTDFVYPGKRTWTDAVHRGRILAGVEQGFGRDHRLRVGIDGGPVLRRARGELLDPWSLPSWAALPTADLVQPLLAGEEFAGDHGELDLFAEAELRDLGIVDLRVGLRASLLNASVTPRMSPRIALVAPLPSGTVLRAGVALTHQDRPELIALGANQDRPERALTASIGAGQAFGDVATIEVLAWGRALDHLLVPDGSREGAWSSTGTGLAGGFDLGGALQLGRFEVHGSWSFLATRRTNPVSVLHAPTRPTAGDQRHDVEVGTRLFVGRRRNFMVGMGYSGASGPPTSSLTPVRQDDGWLWTITALNDQRLAATHRVDLRLEHRIPTRFFLLRASFELNADLGGRVFALNCDAVGDGSEPPTCGALTFWPAVRPWLGLKGEW